MIQEPWVHFNQWRDIKDIRESINLGITIQSRTLAWKKIIQVTLDG